MSTIKNDVVGNVIGNVTGIVVGDVVGNVTGNIIGNVIGNTIGNVMGNIKGNINGSIISSFDNTSTPQHIIMDGSLNVTKSINIKTESIINKTINTNKSLIKGNTTITGKLKGPITTDISGNNIDISGNMYINLANNMINDISFNNDIVCNNMTTNNIVNTTTLSNPQGNIYLPSSLTTNSINILQNSSNQFNSIKSNTNTINLSSTLNINNLNSVNTINSNGNVNIDSSIINIGSSGSTVNINGNMNNIISNNLTINDKLITINKNGTDASYAGIEFEESNVVTGYIKLSNDKNNFLIKPPNSTEQYIMTSNIGIIDSNNTPNTIVSRDSSGNINTTKINCTLNGNITTADKLQTTKTIQFTGGLSGSELFDGSSNITINTTLGTINTNNIMNSSITTPILMDGSITGDKIVEQSIPLSKVSSDLLSRDSLYSNEIIQSDTPDDSLYNFPSFTFTNAGVTGYSGPSLSQIRSSYSATSWTQNTSYLNMTTQGIQLWTVPKTCSYNILVAGAAGGTNAGSAGRGIILQTKATLIKGTVISILVGQSGLGGRNASGGGGSFVVYNNMPLIIAGGGGGGGGYAYGSQNGLDGNSSSSGGSYGGTNAGTAGTNGNGGSGGSDGSGGGNNGGGYFTNGSGGGGYTPNQGNGLNGGSFINGGSGGRANNGAYGGFGGGGCGYEDNGVYTSHSGGGGGGYSGGGGGGTSGNSGGGGGGSYGGIPTGNYNTGNGYVTITAIIPSYQYNSLLYNYSTFTFTNSGQTGLYGPTLATVKSYNSSTTWIQDTTFFNVNTTGYQLWTVPYSGLYTITTVGAGSPSGGNGGSVTGTFILSSGSKLLIVCGQLGTLGNGTGNWWAGGGGGGSFVALGSNVTTATILLVGGGGGGRYYTGGVLSNGQSQGGWALDTISVTSTGGTASGNGGGGGAGVEANGSTNNSNTSPAQSFRNGLMGNPQNLNYGADGGFGGGGGGGGNGGGGGGGWRGGNSTTDAGQGGTSYIITGAMNISSTIGLNSGHGYVTITLLYQPNSVYNILFSQNATGGNKLYTNSGITYNIDTNTFNSNNITYNTLQQSSDIRLKENIKDYNISSPCNTLQCNSFDIIKNLTLKQYNYIGDKKKVIGYLAQDVEKVFPEAIENSEIKTFSPYYITLLHGEAIKELDNKMTKLENNNMKYQDNNDRLSKITKNIK